MMARKKRVHAHGGTCIHCGAKVGWYPMTEREWSELCKGPCPSCRKPGW